MGRKYIDCREIPSEMNCSVAVSGTEDEVLRIAVRHAIEDHREEDTPELREMIRSSMRDEPALGQASRPGAAPATTHGGIH